MKKLFQITLAAILLTGVALGGVQSVTAEEETGRPLLYIAEYSPRPGIGVSPWGSFVLEYRLKNSGSVPAANVIITYDTTDFVPLDGGVSVIGEIDPNSSAWFKHTFKVSDDTAWRYSGLLRATVNYTSENGIGQFSDTFTFTIAIDQPAASATRTPTAVSAAERPQMVINGYDTDVSPLQPGTAFQLTLKVANMGVANANNVTMVYGGGVQAGQDPSVTAQPGGVNGASGDLTNFAPVGRGNVVLLGNVPAGGTASPVNDFIVNVTTVPGAYPLKVSFVYTDPKGTRIVDDQVITLLVMSLPQLEVSFYQDPGFFMAGTPAALPLQVTNLARKQVVLGNMSIKATNGEVSNNTALVGSLDPGGYFTHDAQFMAYDAGPVTLLIEIRYTDDFNQLRTYNAELELEVQPAMEMPTQMPLLDEKGNPVLDKEGNPIMVEPGGMPTDGMGTPIGGGETVNQGFWSKIWNAIKGFFGFGTSEITPTVPSEEQPPVKPVPSNKGAIPARRFKA